MSPFTRRRKRAIEKFEGLIMTGVIFLFLLIVLGVLFYPVILGILKLAALCKYLFSL